MRRVQGCLPWNRRCLRNTVGHVPRLLLDEKPHVIASDVSNTGKRKSRRRRTRRGPWPHGFLFLNWKDSYSFYKPRVFIPILVLRATAPSGRWALPVHVTWGQCANSSNSTFLSSLFSNFYVCVLFFVFNIFASLTILSWNVFVKIVFSKFSISDFFARLFWLLNFYLYKNFAPQFFFQNYWPQNILVYKFTKSFCL
jgi:hypothetical protein